MTEHTDASNPEQDGARASGVQETGVQETGEPAKAPAAAASGGQEPDGQDPDAQQGVDPAEISLPRAATAGVLMSMVRRVLGPLPGPQPRLRFEMPPVQELETEGNGTHPAGPGTRTTAQNPLYMGFMGTVGVGAALGVYWIGSNTTQLLLWIVTALFIALGLDPVVRWLERRNVPRAAGVLISLSSLTLAVVGFFSTLIPTIVEQVTEIVTEAPRWIQDFIDSDFFRSVDSQFGVRDRIQQELEKFVSDPQAMGGIFGGVVGFGTTVANGLFGALIVLVLSLYFLAALPAMKKWGYRLAPRSRRARVEALAEEITGSVGNYVIGQAVVALLNAAFAFIVMSIVGVPFAVLLAFLVALLAFIPLVGGLIAGILVTVIALTAGWQTAVAYAAFYFAYLQFEAYFVSPRIMQKAVAVPGAVAVISVIAGGSLLGVLGALIAIPTAAAILLLLKELVIARQDSR